MDDSDSRLLAWNIRKHAVNMAWRRQSSHIGSCLSVADILAVLYAGVLRVRPAQPDWPERDRVILSKGHAAMALYAALAERGFFPLDALRQSDPDRPDFEGHANYLVPGVELSTGSLGHGLSVGCGMALALRHDGCSGRVFVVLGDGECQEGSVWEAAAFAAHHELGNLVAIVDRNRLQACGATENIVQLEPLGQRWSAFGWNTRSVDGHDHDALQNALAQADKTRFHPHPRVILANTVKGKGVPFMENSVIWHYRPPDDHERRQALVALGCNTRGAETGRKLDGCMTGA